MARLMTTSTSSLKRPSVIEATLEAGRVPIFLRVSGRSHRWFMNRLRANAPSRSAGVRPKRANSFSSVSGWCVPSATMKSSAFARGPIQSFTSRTIMGSGAVRVASGVSTSTRLPSNRDAGTPCSMIARASSVSLRQVPFPVARLPLLTIADGLSVLVARPVASADV